MAAAAFNAAMLSSVLGPECARLPWGNALANGSEEKLAKLYRRVVEEHATLRTCQAYLAGVMEVRRPA